MRSTSLIHLQRAVALFAVCLILSACGRSALYSELDEQQANQVMAALMASGISADKSTSLSKKGFEVDISAGDFPVAMQVMKANGLPGKPTKTMDDLFKTDSFAASAQQEKRLYTYGLQEDVRQKLRKVPGIVDAEVLINFPDAEPLSGEAPESSASVMVFQAPGVNLADRETDLKVFIKDGVTGLKDVNRVTIKFFQMAGQGTAPLKVTGTNSRMPAALAAISPLAIGIALGVAVALALLVGLMSRLRKPVAAKPQKPVWNG